MRERKPVLIVKNISREGPGAISVFLETAGQPYRVIDLSRGEAWPDLPEYSALVVLGGPDSANDAAPRIQEEIRKIRLWIESGRPYLGICLGLQLMVKAMGGSVERNPVKEIGFSDPEGADYTVELTGEGRQDMLFEGLPASFSVFQLHGETVDFKEGGSFARLASGRHCLNQIVRYGTLAYGFQGHFELIPELLDVWKREDPDLQPLDGEALKSKMQSMQRAYASTARAILENFFNLCSAAGDRS